MRIFSYWEIWVITPTRAKILQYMVLGEVIQRCCMHVYGQEQNYRISLYPTSVSLQEA